MRQITDEVVLERLRRENNPNNEPMGHYTGRCMKCGSKDLWTDYTAYGCNHCGNVFFTGDMDPLLVCNHCGGTFEQGQTHVCPKSER